MIRIAIYKRVEEIFEQLEYFEALAIKNNISFNEEVEIDICGKYRKMKKTESLKAMYELLEKLVLTYGIDGSLTHLAFLYKHIKSIPPNNNLLSAGIGELLDEVKRMYKAHIERKLPKLIELINKEDASSDKIISLIAFEDKEYCLGITPKSESVEQISLWTKKEEKEENNAIGLIANRRLSLKSFTTQYIINGMGWQEFNNSMFALITLSSDLTEQGKISANFIPCLSEICNEIMQENMEIIKLRRTNPQLEWQHELKSGD